MSDLIIIGYPDETTAENVWAELGAYGIDTLAGAVRAAKAHALISSGRQPQQTF